MEQAIPIEKLQGYHSVAWSKDYFFETTDKKYTFWFYNVLEQSMGAYYGHISIFEKSADTLPILSSGNVWVWFARSNPITYASKSDCLIFVMSAYQGENVIKLDFPYLLIKPSDRCFSFIDWNYTSIYYSFNEVSANIIEVNELEPNELDRTSFARRTGEIINLDKLIWHDLIDFDQAMEIYLRE